MYKVIYLFFIAASFDAISAGLAGTRYVYNEWTKNNRITIVNSSNKESLVQVFVSHDAGEESKVGSVSALPELFSLGAGARRIVKLYGLSEKLISDRESVLYINVTSLPPVDKKEEGAIASVDTVLTTKYKLFVRPNSMKGMSLSDAVKSMKVSKDGRLVTIKNDSPFHISIAKLSASGFQSSQFFVKPFSSFNVEATMVGPLSVTYVDDDGDYVTESVPF